MNNQNKKASVFSEYKYMILWYIKWIVFLLIIALVLYHLKGNYKWADIVHTCVIVWVIGILVEIAVKCIFSTPLIFSVYRGQYRITKELIEAGVDVNERDYKEYTALIYAVSERYLDIVELLISSGAHINIKVDGITALMHASDDGYQEIVELLIKSGADVNAKDNEGRTALMRASEDGYQEIVELLIKSGADVNAKDNDGDTALEYAATDDIAELLEEHADDLHGYSDINSTDVSTIENNPTVTSRRRNTVNSTNHKRNIELNNSISDNKPKRKRNIEL